MGEEKPLKVSFQEVYLDSVRDLLNKANVQKNANLSSKYEATQVEVSSAERVFKLFKRADENRKVASTVCNASSSRSHLIFQIRLNFDGNVSKTLCLIDLAGSERLD